MLSPVYSVWLELTPAFCFLQHKLYLVPRDQFTMEYIEPKVHCINSHGQFSPDRYSGTDPHLRSDLFPVQASIPNDHCLCCYHSSSCAPSRFQTPSDSLVLKDGQSSSTQEQVLTFPAVASPLPPYQKESSWSEGVRPPFGADTSDHIRLDSVQVQRDWKWNCIFHCSVLCHIRTLCPSCLLSGSFRMQQCSPHGSTPWVATSSFSTTISLPTPHTLFRSTSTEDESGKVPTLTKQILLDILGDPIWIPGHFWWWPQVWTTLPWPFRNIDRILILFILLFYFLLQVTPTLPSVLTLMAAVTSSSLRTRSFWMWLTTRCSSRCRYL